MSVVRGTLAGPAAAVAALTLPLSGIVAASTPEPPQQLGAVCSAVPEGLNLVIPHMGGVVAATSTGAELIDAPIAAGPTIAVRGPDGTVWVEATPDGRFGVSRIPPGATASLVVEGDVSLTGVGWLGGRSAAAVIDSNGEALPDDPDGFGAVLVDASDGQQADLGPAGAWEWQVRTATIGGGAVVIAGVGEAFESFGAVGPNGQPVDWFSLSEDRPDTEPTYWWPVAGLSAAGSQPVLSWTEQTQHQDEQGRWISSWQVVVVDAATGAEIRRVDLGEVGQSLVHADFDGRFWVGTFADSVPADGGEGQPVRILAVDTTAPAPSAVDVGCPPGATATIDRLGAAEPPSPPTVAPAATTTAVPAPGQCDDYVADDLTYPIHRCEQGWHVRLAQMLLVYHGAGVEVDGYFGPATEQAVREFQGASGLEVDGLVGPDTWSALLAGVPPIADDHDGNGLVDPWEFPLDCALTGGQWECAGDPADS
jgi:Putative peptidoglycan binding domain